eukprot:TRINITY_DN5561_c0_g1_i1.p1 TRINITY_DN5561_c0_g1~~TRINITY_DN5561_c0_g1_i1.p1  ORF type:complete len:476 (-),score=128.91 TRINITY_DN5561_c0_g1_i1:230-1657(-)
MNQIKLDYFIVFNVQGETNDDTDEGCLKNVRYYFPDLAPKTKKIEHVNNLRAIIEVSKIFDLTDVKTFVSEDDIIAFHQIYPNFWIACSFKTIRIKTKTENIIYNKGFFENAVQTFLNDYIRIFLLLIPCVDTFFTTNDDNTINENLSSIFSKLFEYSINIPNNFIDILHGYKFFPHNREIFSEIISVNSIFLYDLFQDNIPCLLIFNDNVVYSTFSNTIYQDILLLLNSFFGKPSYPTESGMLCGLKGSNNVIDMDNSISLYIDEIAYKLSLFQDGRGLWNIICLPNDKIVEYSIENFEKVMMEHTFELTNILLKSKPYFQNIQPQSKNLYYFYVNLNTGNVFNISPESHYVSKTILNLLFHKAYNLLVESEINDNMLTDELMHTIAEYLIDNKELDEKFNTIVAEENYKINKIVMNKKLNMSVNLRFENHWIHGIQLLNRIHLAIMPEINDNLKQSLAKFKNFIKSLPGSAFP